MRRNNLRAHCEEMVDRLDLSSSFDLQSLCDHVSQRVGRQIVLIPLALPPEAPCGLWIRTAKADYVFVERQTSMMHRLHIGLHELGHLLFDHTTDAVVTTETEGILPSTLNPELIQQVLNRSHYDEAAELEAETFAGVAVQRVKGWSAAGVPAPPIPTEIAEFSMRFEASLNRASNNG